MARDTEEWFRQAAYDMDTAEDMFRSGRHLYAVFMCHLSIEKALKGLFQQRFGTSPPKLHNLLYFVEKLGLSLPDDLHDLVFTLNRLAIVTRYPDDLRRALSDFGESRTTWFLTKGKEVLQWLRERLSEP